MNEDGMKPIAAYPDPGFLFLRREGKAKASKCSQRKVPLLVESFHTFF